MMSWLNPLDFYIYFFQYLPILADFLQKKIRRRKNLPNSCRTQAWHICEAILGYSLPYADLPEVLFCLAKRSF